MSNPPMPPDNAPMVEWALYYAQLGLKVIPGHNPLFDKDGACTACSCEAYKRSDRYRQWLIAQRREREFNPQYKCATPGKHPRFAKWQELATSDEKTIRQWWSRWPNAPVGHNPGKAEFGPHRRPLIMLDGDSYKETYEGAALALPTNTPTALTGNLGEHDYFYMPHGKAYGQHTGELPEGIDVRGVDGYDILPPSIHYSGRRYQWEADLSLSDTEPLELPQHVIDLIESHNGQKGAAIGPSDIEAVNRSSATVESLLKHADLGDAPAQAWGEGRRYILPDCPFNPADDPHATDGASFIVVYQDGTIGAGCHHNRCRHVIQESGLSGWGWIKQEFGYVDAELQDRLQEYKRRLASPQAIADLKLAGFRSPERARKLLDTILEKCEAKQSSHVKPGYTYLAKQAGIAKGGIGVYLAKLFVGGFINLHLGSDGEPTAIELVFDNLNTSVAGDGESVFDNLNTYTSIGEGVQVVKNWHFYRAWRSSEAFINNHFAYSSTRTMATLPSLGANGLGVMLALLDGPATTKEAAEAVGYTYGSMAYALRHWVPHELVEVAIGPRGVKTYTLKPEWEEILKANLHLLPTFGVQQVRTVDALKSKVALLEHKGEVEKAEKVETEYQRQASLLAQLRQEAGIIPFVRPIGVDKLQPVITRAGLQAVPPEVLQRRERTDQYKNDRAWRDGAEFAELVALCGEQWGEFNAWACMQGWLMPRDMVAIIDKFQIYRRESELMPLWARQAVAA
jgi:hypothetical protein